MDQIVARVTEGGRIVIPASVRRQLNLSMGDEVVMLVKDSEVTLLSRAEALRRAQAIVASRVPRERSLVEELLAERRCEGQLE